MAANRTRAKVAQATAQTGAYGRQSAEPVGDSQISHSGFRQRGDVHQAGDLFRTTDRQGTQVAAGDKRRCDCRGLERSLQLPTHQVVDHRRLHTAACGYPGVQRLGVCPEIDSEAAGRRVRNRDRERIRRLLGFETQDARSRSRRAEHPDRARGMPSATVVARAEDHAREIVDLVPREEGLDHSAAAKAGSRTAEQ